MKIYIETAHNNQHPYSAFSNNIMLVSTRRVRWAYVGVPVAATQPLMVNTNMLILTDLHHRTRTHIPPLLLPPLH